MIAMRRVTLEGLQNVAFEILVDFQRVKTMVAMYIYIFGLGF